MPEPIEPGELSQRELDEYLDRLVRDGEEDSPEFRRAYEIWDRNA